MDKYNITGMSCAACSSRVEKAVSSLPGVSQCSVNLLTNSMIVEGDASSEIIISAVIDAGYGAKKVGEDNGPGPENVQSSNDSEFRQIRLRLIFSIAFMFVLMYFSMGQMFFEY